MEQERKRFWTRPWKGWRAVLSWFIVLFAAAFIALFAVALASEHPSLLRGSIVAQSLMLAGFAAIIATAGILFLSWVCNGRNVRRFLFGLACFATLVALFYAEENIRGKLAWNKYVKEETAKGEVLDLLQLAPAPIPDEENFFMTPLWDSYHFTVANGQAVWASDDPMTEMFDISGPNRTAAKFNFFNWQIGKKDDLAVWQAFYRGTSNLYSADEKTFTNYFAVSPQPQSPAEDVLLALSRFDEQRQLLIEACSRPKARFWINYDAGFAALLPHLSGMKVIVTYLSLHSIAASYSGDPKTALEDIRLSFRLMQSVRNEPILISHLVRIAMLEITMQAIWEGLADHCWSDEQLHAIDTQLKQLNFLEDYERSMRGERVFGIWSVDYVEKNRQRGLEEILGALDDDWQRKLWAVLLIRLAPKGWFDQNKVALCQAIDDYFLPLVDLDQQIADPEATKTALDALDGLYVKPAIGNCAVRLLLPAMSLLVQKFAYAQATTDLARVAFALERYRLANGDCPESLESLTPRFIKVLPHDVINGQPLHYRHISNDRFILYSVGWNETDDGGEVALSDSGKTIDKNQGDWVWQYPLETIH